MVENFVRILVGLAVVASASVAVYYIGFMAMAYFEAPLLSTPIYTVAAFAVGLVVMGLIVAALGFSHLVGCLLLGMDVKEKD
jgi:uncharacterized membrane protein (DUF485 family)